MGNGISKASKKGDKNSAEEEKRGWLMKPRFSDLPPTGLKEFKSFLSEGDRFRLSFYMKNPSFDADVLRPYISDGPNMIKDVNEEQEYKDEILSKAQDVAEYVSKLRRSMTPDLNNQFSKFKEEINKELS